MLIYALYTVSFMSLTSGSVSGWTTLLAVLLLRLFLRIGVEVSSGEKVKWNSHFEYKVGY